MRFLFTVLILVFGSRAFACKCAYNDPVHSFGTSEFVGHIKITKVYPNEGERLPYRADVELLELFKGSKINLIFVGGRSDGKIGTSCDVFYPVGSELVVTANKNEDGQLVFGMCSFIIDLKTERGNNQRDLDVIRTLSQWDNEYSVNSDYTISTSYSDFLGSKNGIQLKEKFALFEVMLNDQHSPLEINVIKGFDDAVDSEIVDALLNSKWQLKSFDSNSPKLNHVKIVVPVYFYPSERGEESFMSKFSL